ncbi:MAG: type II secretion system protein [Candidatus Pacebacteria bacterium]|nr:type II secretion system protein [Candidatus Paceibacterota bacterium]
MNKLNSMNKTKRGFTLIELLVVVAIIGILASVVMVSLSSARVKGRNAARLESMHTLRNAFYIALESGSFPTSGWACVAASCYGLWSPYDSSASSEHAATNAAVLSFLGLSANQLPVDPGGTGYGGYMYYNSGGIGPLIEFLQEPGGSCGAAVVHATQPTYVDCWLYLN